MKNVFIIGSKGIPSNYGGFETFVEQLVQRKRSERIKYHVSCLSEDNNEFKYQDARCFNIKVPNFGAAKAVFYDIKAIRSCIKYIEKNKLNSCIVYILACRIGPFVNIYKRKLNKMGVQVLVNPDGHEWKRGKWSKPVREYWKISEKLMVKNSNLLVCDSKKIEEYITDQYVKYKPKTTFIAYGADMNKSRLADEDETLVEWYKKNNVNKKEYYLVVGRFVPENNYETMIIEFMKSKSKKDFVIITNVEKNRFYESLKAKTSFDKDKRIKFVGTVYDKELIKKIRENAYAYFHGHEVGGTNPSLVEALATTDINILLDVGFNREVAEDGALYFNKEEGNLSGLINDLENVDVSKIKKYANKAKQRVNSMYTWDKIVKDYEDLFLSI